MRGLKLKTGGVENRARHVSATNRWREQIGRKPCFATVLLGERRACVIYVRMNQYRCRQVGNESRSQPGDALPRPRRERLASRAQQRPTEHRQRPLDAAFLHCQRTRPAKRHPSPLLSVFYAPGGSSSPRAPSPAGVRGVVPGRCLELPAAGGELPDVLAAPRPGVLDQPVASQTRKQPRGMALSLDADT